MKKAASALVLAGTLTFTGAAVATASDLYPAPPTATTGTVSSAFVFPGQSFQFLASGFTPGEPVRLTITFYVDSDTSSGLVPVFVQHDGGVWSGIDSAAPAPITGIGGRLSVPGRIALQPQGQLLTADAQGAISVPITIADPGTYTITAVGQTSGHTTSATVVVDPAAGGTGTGAGTAASESALADTGADNTTLLLGAAGALALGAGVVSISVVRRKQQA